MKAKEFVPSYWIDTGAAAISTLAGCTLIKAMDHVPLFETFIPALKVFSILYWVASSWWIPLVIILEIWRHTKIPLRYSVSYWSLVFPLGMYTATTYLLVQTIPLPYLAFIPNGFIYVSWAAWVVVFIGMCKRVIGTYIMRSGPVKHAANT